MNPGFDDFTVLKLRSFFEVNGQIFVMFRQTDRAIIIACVIPLKRLFVNRNAKCVL